MLRLAPALFRVLKPRGHIYMFFCNEMYPVLMKVLQDTGFIMSPVPVIWDKGRTTGPFMGYTYTASYEPVLFGHKPPRKKRLADPCRDIIVEKIVSSDKKLHPFEKPQGLLRYFIRQSTNMGGLILDPFAGSGATLIAAKAEGRMGIGFEIDGDNFRKAQKRLLGVGNEVEEK